MGAVIAISFRWSLYLSTQATITKYYRLCNSDNRNLFSYSFGSSWGRSSPLWVAAVSNSSSFFAQRFLLWERVDFTGISAREPSGSKWLWEESSGSEQEKGVASVLETLSNSTVSVLLALPIYICPEPSHTKITCFLFSKGIKNSSHVLNKILKIVMH